MSEIKAFYYNKQLRSYILQFMSIFADMNVEVGKNATKDKRLITVPIANASKDRVVASIKGEHTQNKLLRLPMMSAYLTGIEQAPELRKGVGQTRRNAYLPTGQLFPDDINVVHQRMPVPYMANFELGIFASNEDQHYQILEQILSIYDPILQIQTSDEIFDWTRITQVELTGITFDENQPSTNARRIIQTTLNFQTHVYIGIPADVRQNFVKDIYLRVGAVSQASQSSEDIIAELDSQGLDYNLILSLDDVDLTQSS